MFVVIEGPEGAGKSTLARGLQARFLAEGRAVLAVREPGGTPVAEAARKVALKSEQDLAPAVELFLILAARADLVERVIRPALEAGEVVLADRFDLSTRAYQVAGRGLDRELVGAALRLSTGGLVPDLTLVLDVDPEVAAHRRRIRGGRGELYEDSELQQRLCEAYRQAEMLLPGDKIMHVDANRPIDAVLDDCIRAVGS